MAWTTPKTWTSEPLTSTDLNTYMRDNQNYLKDRLDGSAAGQYTSTVGETSTTSTTFTNVDGTNLVKTFTTTGGDVMVTMIAGGYNSGGAQPIYTAIDVDGTDYDFIRSFVTDTSSTGNNLSGTKIITGLSAGSHTFSLQFRAAASTSYITVFFFDVRETVGIA